MSISRHQKQLLQLLADGRFHSGTELAQALDVSRSAIWKQLQPLSELGMEWVAVSGKGYKLQHPLQLLNQQQITDGLDDRAKALIQRWIIHDIIDSTNTYLLGQSSQTGLVCLAEYQTGGKGRRGRAWVSPFGHNIYLSVLWRYQHGPAAIAGLSLAIGVAVVSALQQLGVNDVGLKWPNDIYWQQRKLAGILIEVSGESSGPCQAVIGLGLNLYLPSQQASGIEQAWVDLEQICGTSAHQQRNRLIALLLNQIMPVLADFEQHGLAHYLNQWRSLDVMRGKPATLYLAEQTYQGIVMGIDDQGLLLLQDQTGNSRVFASGEVSFSGP